MKDDNRLAGLGAEALSEAERETVVKLALEMMAQVVAVGPVMTGERAAARYLQLKVGDREREVFGCLFLNTRRRLIRDEAVLRLTRPHRRVPAGDPAEGAGLQRGRDHGVTYSPELGGRAIGKRHGPDRPREGSPRRDRRAAPGPHRRVPDRDRQHGRPRPALTDRRAEGALLEFSPWRRPRVECAAALTAMRLERFGGGFAAVHSLLRFQVLSARARRPRRA